MDAPHKLREGVDEAIGVGADQPNDSKQGPVEAEKKTSKVGHHGDEHNVAAKEVAESATGTYDEELGGGGKKRADDDEGQLQRSLQTRHVVLMVRSCALGWPKGAVPLTLPWTTLLPPHRRSPGSLAQAYCA